TVRGAPGPGALVRFEHDRRPCDRRIGQRSRVGEVAVLGAQLVERAVVQRAEGAGCHAGRVFTGSLLVHAEVALGDDAGFRVELRSAVRAGPFAVAAADALVGVGDHDAVRLALVHGARRAVLDAWRVFAVHAGGGDVVGIHIRRQHQVAVLHPVATAVLQHAAVVDAERHVVVILARDLAGLAPGALPEVDVERELFTHVGLLMPSQPAPGSCAAGCPSQTASGGTWSAY